MKVLLGLIFVTTPAAVIVSPAEASARTMTKKGKKDDKGKKGEKLMTASSSAAPITMAPVTSSPIAPALIQPWDELTPLNVAHREGVFENPEHIIYGLTLAVENRADVLEADVTLCQSGEVVLMHDSTVDRTTDGTGRVTSLSPNELKALDAATFWGQYRGITTGAVAPVEGFSAEDFQVAAFQELLETLPTTRLAIEVKDFEGSRVATANETAAMLLQYGHTEDVLVSSFDRDTIETFEMAAPMIPTSPGEPEMTTWILTFFAGVVLPLDTYWGIHIPYKVPSLRFVNGTLPVPAMVPSLQDLGLTVIVYLEPRFETLADYAYLFGLGVNGIIIDYPTRLKAFLESS